MASLTVATLNLKKGELRWGERAPLLMEQLVALRPDVIGFQEVDLRLDQGNGIRGRMNDLLEEPPGYAVHHVACPRQRVSLEALAIMTRLPVLAHEAYDFLIDNRVAHRVRVSVDGRPFDLYNTHFHHVGDEEGHQIRLRQTQALLAWIDERSGDRPFALVGDLNSWPDAPAIDTLRERLRSAHEAVDSVQPTFPSPLVPNPHDPRPRTIDYIFVPEGVNVIEAERVFDQAAPDDETLLPSDHFGLMATLDI